VNYGVPICYVGEQIRICRICYVGEICVYDNLKNQKVVCTTSRHASEEKSTFNILQFLNAKYSSSVTVVKALL
jgi:hypothetical protein